MKWQAISWQGGHYGPPRAPLRVKVRWVLSDKTGLWIFSSQSKAPLESQLPTKSFVEDTSTLTLKGAGGAIVAPLPGDCLPFHTGAT